MAKRVLVVDDEKLIVKGIRFSLEHEDFEVECAYDGEEALEKVKEKPFDIILLDVMLPKLTGFEVCQQIREFSDVPIIMLTAKGDDMDKILGLEYGADDYITKPFNILEVKARIKAIIRRSGRSGQKKDENKNEQIQTENEAVRLDKDGRRAFIEGREVSLTAKEFELLEFLMTCPWVLKNSSTMELLNGLNSMIRQRDWIVGSSAVILLVKRITTPYSGGSSMVFNKAF